MTRSQPTGDDDPTEVLRAWRDQRREERLADTREFAAIGGPLTAGPQPVARRRRVPLAVVIGAGTLLVAAGLAIAWAADRPPGDAATSGAVVASTSSSPSTGTATDTTSDASTPESDPATGAAASDVPSTPSGAAAPAAGPGGGPARGEPAGDGPVGGRPGGGPGRASPPAGNPGPQPPVGPS